jgi:hypothetical protein
MQLSDSVILGDSLRSRLDTRYLSTHSGVKCGCALGGALLANGYTESSASLPEIQAEWPWLTSEQIATISVKFMDVCSGWTTIEQLAEYIKTIEPREENRDGANDAHVDTWDQSRITVGV